MHLYAYEYISASKLDRLIKDDFFEVNLRFLDEMRDLEKSGSAGSSRDRRGSDATRGRPVSRGPAVSEPSTTEAHRTSGSANEASRLERKLRELKQRIKDSRSGKP